MGALFALPYLYPYKVNSHLYNVTLSLKLLLH